MSKRFTDTEKWADPWFLDRTPKAKLLFNFLCDKCDIAGFFERNDRTTSFYTGIAVEDISGLFTELSKSVIIRDRWVFVRNFLRHQKNFPLNSENNCHKAIIKSLFDKNDLFSDVYKELDLGLVRGLLGAKKGLTSPIGIGIGKGKGKDKDSLSLKPLATVIPEDLLCSESEIKDWLDYKKQKGQTYKSKGLDALWRMFRAIHPSKRREAVDFSMSNNWAGLFEKKENQNGKQGTYGKRIAEDMEHERTDSKFSGIVKTYRVPGSEEGKN